MAIETKEKNCEEECPYCESANIDYIDIDTYSCETIIEIYKCNQCEREFNQIVYIERNYYITEYEVETDLNKRTLFDRG